MPRTNIVIYQERPGKAPLLEWLDSLPDKGQEKCIALIELLEQYGHELRRPHSDILEQGIYELRARYKKMRYRILYAFVGEKAVLLSHGFTKKSGPVPMVELKRAKMYLANYVENPEAHTYAEGL